MKENTNLTIQEMVAEVDRFISEMELPIEIDRVKTNQDKVLYYFNHIYPKNAFRNVLEFPNYYYIKLANLLCNSTERINIFNDKFYNPDENIAQQFRKYRRYLLDTRENVNEYLGIMEKMIKGRCFEELYSVIQELFLEPLEQHIFDRIVNMIHNDGLSASDIYNFYITKRNVKSLVTYNVNYIKSLKK